MYGIINKHAGRTTSTDSVSKISGACILEYMGAVLYKRLKRKLVTVLLVCDKSKNDLGFEDVQDKDYRDSS